MAKKQGPGKTGSRKIGRTDRKRRNSTGSTPVHAHDVRVSLPGMASFWASAPIKSSPIKVKVTE